MKKLIIHTTIAVSLFLHTTDSNAIDLNLGFKASANLSATAGLDDKTIEFINGLPDKVRQQIIVLLQQALPLIDISVEKYMNKVNDILDIQITHLECAVIGAGETLGADLKSSLPFAHAPEPVETLQSDTDKIIGGLSATDTPNLYSQRYADLLYRSATTSCQVSISPQASIAVNALINNIRPRWDVWYRVNGTCDAPKDCFVKVQDRTKLIMSSSDIRDVAAINATPRMAHVKLPTFPGWLPTKWNPTDTETAIGELLSIQDGIIAAKSARIAIASAYIVDADRLTSVAEAAFASASSNQNSNDLNVLANAVGAAASATHDISKIQDELAKAKVLDASVSDRAASISAREAVIVANAPGVGKAANDRAGNIRADQEAKAAAIRAALRSIPRGPTIFKP